MSVVRTTNAMVRVQSFSKDWQISFTEFNFGLDEFLDVVYMG